MYAQTPYEEDPSVLWIECHTELLSAIEDYPEGGY